MWALLIRKLPHTHNHLHTEMHADNRHPNKRTDTHARDYANRCTPRPHLPMPPRLLARPTQRPGACRGWSEAIIAASEPIALPQSLGGFTASTLDLRPLSALGTCLQETYFTLGLSSLKIKLTRS